MPDPEAVEGDEFARKNAFRNAYRQLENRILLFANLRIAELDRLALKRKVDEIGNLDRNGRRYFSSTTLRTGKL